MVPISSQEDPTRGTLYLRAPILWFSKRQNTVETSAFSSEMIAMKTCMEAIQALRYKLKMFGVPLMGPTEVFCFDNNSLVLNTSNVESKVNKKHNSLAFYAIRWSVVAEIMRVAWLSGKENISDAMTNILSKGIKGIFIWKLDLLIIHDVNYLNVISSSLHALRELSEIKSYHTTHRGLSTHKPYSSQAPLRRGV